MSSKGTAGAPVIISAAALLLIVSIVGLIVLGYSLHQYFVR
jgi:hypothetical protein